MSTTSTSTAGSAAGSTGVDTDWDRLSLFRITVEGQGTVVAPVFANGKQQVPILIEIIAEKNGKTVTLTDSQLKRITLAEHGKDGALPVGLTLSFDKSPQFEYDWSLIKPIKRGDLDGEELKVQPHDPSKMGQVQMIWVSCTLQKMVTVAARIKSPSGAWQATDSLPAATTKFDSWVMIDGQAPTHHAWTALTMGDREDLISNSDWDVDMYYIKFKDSNTRIVDSVHHNHAADHHFYSWPKGNWARMSSAAFQAGARRKVVFPPGIASGCSFEVNTLPGQANAARVAHRLSYDLRQTYEFGRVTYFDQHGNPAPAVIAVSSDGNSLQLQSTGQHAAVDASSKSADATGKQA